MAVLPVDGVVATAEEELPAVTGVGAEAAVVPKETESVALPPIQLVVPVSNCQCHK